MQRLQRIQWAFQAVLAMAAFGACNGALAHPRALRWSYCPFIAAPSAVSIRTALTQRAGVRMTRHLS